MKLATSAFFYRNITINNLKKNCMTMKKTVLLFLLAMLSVTVAVGQPIKYNDVYYDANKQTRIAQVTAPPSYAYKGDLKIVPSFSYAGITYTVTGIKDKAFHRADNVTSVEIPEGLTFIGNQAFVDCTGLTSIVVPSTVETLGEKAFYCCQNLKSITIPVKEIGKSAFGECSSLETVEIPNTVTTIGIEAFNFCKNLKTVIIGKGVKEIKAQAFANNRELRTVYCHAEAVPQTEVSAFYEMWAEKTTLYVPENLIAQYRSQLPWSKFNTIAVTGIKDIPASELQVKANKGSVTVSGANSGESVAVYDAAGKLIATATTNNGNLSLPTTLRRGDIVLVKIGEKMVKTIVK